MSLEIARRIVLGCAGPDERAQGHSTPAGLRSGGGGNACNDCGGGDSAAQRPKPKTPAPGEQKKLFHAAILARTGAQKRRNFGAEYAELPSTRRLPEPGMSLESRQAHPNL